MSLGTKRVHPFGYKRASLTAAAIAVVVILTGCSSTSKGSTSSTGATPTSTGVTPTSSTGGSPTSSAASSSNPQVAAAAAQVAKYEAVPTAMTVTTPLKAAPPSGKTFIWLNADNAQSTTVGKGVQSAAEAIGWKFKQIAFTSANPATLVTGLNAALQLHPTAVGLDSLPQVLWQSVVPAYKAAGVPIIAAFTGDASAVDPVIAEIASPSDFALNGKMIADWFIADSNGTGKAVLLRVDDFPILKAFSDSFEQTVRSNCSACKVVDVKGTIAQAAAGQVVAPVVNALRANPGYDYAIACDAPVFTGMSGALNAAGLSGKVSIAGPGAETQTLTLLKTDPSYKALTGLALTYSGWQIVDAALRHLEGMTVPPDDGGLPTQLLTKSVPFTVSDSYNQPANFMSLFKELWHVS
jgi:ribose transport system substrate-binding protein